MLAGLVGRGEEVFGVFLEELGKNPRVREQVGKTLERAVDAKRAVDKNMQTVLSALNVPSRTHQDREPAGQHRQPEHEGRPAGRGAGDEAPGGAGGAAHG